MSDTLWITDEIEVTPRAEILAEVGANDTRVALRIGDSLWEAWPYLETNGGPRLIQKEAGAYYCSIKEAADALKMDRNELVALVRAQIPGIDWQLD